MNSLDCFWAIRSVGKQTWRLTQSSLNKNRGESEKCTNKHFIDSLFISRNTRLLLFWRQLLALEPNGKKDDSQPNTKDWQPALGHKLFRNVRKMLAKHVIVTTNGIIRATWFERKSLSEKCNNSRSTAKGKTDKEKRIVARPHAYHLCWNCPKKTKRVLSLK